MNQITTAFIKKEKTFLSAILTKYRSILNLINLYCPSWTLFCTNAAVGTTLRINMGKIVCNGNRPTRTGFLTFFASNTTILTNLPSLSALIMAGTADKNLAGSRDNINQMVGTFLRTHATTYAFALIHHRNSIDNMDRIISPNPKQAWEQLPLP